MSHLRVEFPKVSKGIHISSGRGIFHGVNQGEREVTFDADLAAKNHRVDHFGGERGGVSGVSVRPEYVSRSLELENWLRETARDPTTRRCRRTLKGAFGPPRARRELTSHPFATDGGRAGRFARGRCDGRSGGSVGVAQPRKLCRCIDAKMFNRQSRHDCRPRYVTALIAAR